MIDWLINKLGFDAVVHIKHFLIFMSGFSLGILCCFFIVAWLYQVGVKDEDFDGIKIARLRRGGKELFIGNPRTPMDTIHGIFIILGWKLGLIRKNNVYFENAKGSRIAMYVVILAAILVILLGFLFSFVVFHESEAFRYMHKYSRV